MPVFVNGEPVDEELIRAEANTIRPKLREFMQGESPAVIDARAKDWARENIVERVLLRQAALAAAKESGNGSDTPLEAAVESLLAKITENVSRPRNKDVTEFYRKNREELVQDEAVHAAHILKKIDEAQTEEAAQAAIEAVRDKLASGANFEELATSDSDDPVPSGDLGFFTRGRMVPEFESVVFSLASGQVSAPFRTQFGFHIAKVYERRPAGIPRLEEIRDRIEETIYRQKRQKVIEQYLDRLRSKAEISQT